MQKNPFIILGISENATQQEAFEAYTSLRKQYSEDRFLEGEAGANAAKKLSEIEQAYTDCLDLIRNRSDEGGKKPIYDEIASAIREKDIYKAQTLLDDISERGAEWHYYQSIVFYNKGWMLDSKKQLEIAVSLEPSNEKYRTSLSKMEAKMNPQQPNAGAQGQTNTQGGYYDNTAGGNPNSNTRGGYEQPTRTAGGCTCCDFCAGMLCADMCCDCMGGGCC